MLTNNYWDPSTHKSKPDLKTFTPLNKLYSRDAGRVYTHRGLVDQADVATFAVVGSTENPFNDGASGYAKDASNVYHCVLGGHAYIIEGADAKSFRALGNGYACDDAAVYFERKKLPGADPLNWAPIKGPHSKSGKNAYFLAERIRGADGQQLESLPMPKGGPMLVKTGTFDAWWCRQQQTYYTGNKSYDGQNYFDEFRRCFVFLAVAHDVTLSMVGGKSLPSAYPDSWEMAALCQVSLTCIEWLQKPDIDIINLPEVGQRMQFKEGLTIAYTSPHLNLRYPPVWLNTERIWIFAPYLRSGGKWEILNTQPLWWEYGDHSQLQFVKDLIVTAKTA